MPDTPRGERDPDPLRDRVLTRSLLRSAGADPHHLPEFLAAFAVRHMGPVAAGSVARLRAAQPAGPPPAQPAPGAAPAPPPTGGGA
ncbi:hypothetical protein ACWERJ_38345, partial [Streptomyces sp. NPDC004050]